MKLVTETSAIQPGLFEAGLMTINAETAPQLAQKISQARHSTGTQVLGLVRSIEEYGYDFGKPIVFNFDNVVVDGASRCRAILKLIKDGVLTTIDVPFISASTEPDSFNNTRGLSVYDLQPIFQRAKMDGISYGKTSRAVDQAIEAAKMLSARDTSYSNAFDPKQVQCHLVTIDDNIEKFSKAFDAVISLMHGKSPDSCKFAHWLAFFARHGVSTTTLNIAKQNHISVKGSYQDARYNVFRKMETTLSTLPCL